MIISVKLPLKTNELTQNNAVQVLFKKFFI